jgi:hypothetical protein
MTTVNNPIKVISTKSTKLVKETHTLQINEKDYLYTDFLDEKGIFTDWSFQDGDGKFILVEAEMEPVIIAIQNTVDAHLNRPARHDKIVQFTDSVKEPEVIEEEDLRS